MLPRYIMIAMTIISSVRVIDEIVYGDARLLCATCEILLRSTLLQKTDSSRDDVTLCNIRALSPPNLFCVITKRDKLAATKWKKISCNERSLLGILMNASILKPRH